MSFVHLHVHTEYSLLDGSNKIKEYINAVKEFGMNSAAITDHGVMYGVIDFYRTAKEAGIKPIIGCEVYVAPKSRFIKENTEGQARYYHLVLLAKNNTGYQNLMKIVSKGFVDGFYYKPRVDMETLAAYSEGVIALSACLAGEVARNLTANNYEEAKAAACRHEEIFGKGNYFLEMQDHGIPEQAEVNRQLLKLSEETGIELVATNDVHYTYKDDVKPHDILLCLQTGKKLSDENRMRYDGGQYFVKSEEEMKTLFPYALQAIENTQKVADMCNVKIEFGVTKLPEYNVPEGFTTEEYLRKLCMEGMEAQYGEVTEELMKRLDYEIGVIVEMGYVDYFLIVWDFIKYARDNDISVGPGRGSAAGSIVAYTLGITGIDPIKYQLLFERFLNPERVSMPDIDIDFCYERRQEVIDYVVEKYGTDKVVQIVTFGTMAARGVIRDVGRVMDLPYAYVDTIAKAVPMELGMTLDKALEKSSDFRSLYENDEQVKELIEMSRRLEGLPRHTSMHAAGVVIGKNPIDEYVPLSLGSDGSVTTQFTMTTLEELGLLKMDFLGLRTLTVIQNAVKEIQKKQNELLDIDRIDYNDQDVLDYIGTGKTDGIFQVESAGMKSFMKELKPHTLEDVIAGISLYRPGPMDFIPQYIKGKNDKNAVTYDCPQLKEILEPTYGCIVYQEQVMQIVRDLGGFTLGRSDLLRRAMSKKKSKVMEEERQVFVYGNGDDIKGCVNNGINEKIANKIYDEMIDFAKYAFNKSHAAAYAVVAYQTAYLKYYYPKEFMAALMTSVIDHTSKVSEYIYSSRQMGIKILPPDINKGESEFSVDEDAIRYGLSAIKSVGKQVIDGILRERNENGPFRTIKDLIERCSGKEMNKRTLESFIKSGALDSLEGTRRQLMSVYALVVDRVVQERKNVMAGQITLFDMVDDEQKKEFDIALPEVGEYDKSTMLLFEKEVLGIYVTGHPLEDEAEKWKQNITATSLDFQYDEALGSVNVQDGERVLVGGVIAAKTIKNTRNGKTMAFLTLEDLVGMVEIVIFPRDYEYNRRYLEEDSKIFVRGRVSEEDESASKVICEKIIPFDDTRKELWIQFESKDVFEEKESALYNLMKDSEGEDQVVIFCKKERAVKRLSRNQNVNAQSDLVEKLKDFIGEDSVKLLEKPIENRG